MGWLRVFHWLEQRQKEFKVHEQAITVPTSLFLFFRESFDCDKVYITFTILSIFQCAFQECVRVPQRNRTYGRNIDTHVFYHRVSYDTPHTWHITWSLIRRDWLVQLRRLRSPSICRLQARGPGGVTRSESTGLRTDGASGVHVSPRMADEKRCPSSSSEAGKKG